MKFRVIDKKTGKEADTWNIALNEEWAQSLIYCDMEGFAITEDGNLVLMDECGHVVYCDTERFKVEFEDERTHGEWKFIGDNLLVCTECGYVNDATWLGNWRLRACDSTYPRACPNCGAYMSANDE